MEHNSRFQNYICIDTHKCSHSSKRGASISAVRSVKLSARVLFYLLQTEITYYAFRDTIFIHETIKYMSNSIYLFVTWTHANKLEQKFEVIEGICSELFFFSPSATKYMEVGYLAMMEISYEKVKNI